MCATPGNWQIAHRPCRSVGTAPRMVARTVGCSTMTPTVFGARLCQPADRVLDIRANIHHSTCARVHHFSDPRGWHVLSLPISRALAGSLAMIYFSHPFLCRCHTQSAVWPCEQGELEARAVPLFRFMSGANSPRRLRHPRDVCRPHRASQGGHLISCAVWWSGTVERNPSSTQRARPRVRVCGRSIDPPGRLWDASAASESAGGPRERRPARALLLLLSTARARR